MSGAGWQAAVQRATNAFLDYILMQMKACSGHYAKATNRYSLSNVCNAKILQDNDAGCLELKPVTGIYRESQRGFSLLEVMVAFSIMALSLGLLYNITGSSARQVGSVQQHEQAMALAASVLDTVPAVPEQGIAHSEEAAGYEWTIATRPWPTQHDAQGTVPRLHEVQVTVLWQDGERTREFSLVTLRPERLPEPEQ